MEKYIFNKQRKILILFILKADEAAAGKLRVWFSDVLLRRFCSCRLSYRPDIGPIDRR